MIPENRHIIDARMNKNELEILIRGSEEIIPENAFLKKIKRPFFRLFWSSSIINEILCRIECRKQK